MREEVQITTPEESELDRVLIALGEAGHGKLYCTCGYLIWSCPCKTGCKFQPRMVETDHQLCKKPVPKTSAFGPQKRGIFT